MNGPWVPGPRGPPGPPTADIVALKSVDGPPPPIPIRNWGPKMAPGPPCPRLRNIERKGLLFMFVSRWFTGFTFFEATGALWPRGRFLPEDVREGPGALQRMILVKDFLQLGHEFWGGRAKRTWG